MPKEKHVTVSEEEHDRRLKAYFLSCRNVKSMPCKECRSYIGCLKTRAYNEMGLIFDPLKQCYRDKRGRIVKKL